MSMVLRPFPATGRQPFREFTCPECGTVFVSRNVIKDGKNGKVCPNNHFTSLAALRKFDADGVVPVPREKKERQAPQSKARRSVVRVHTRAEALDEFTRQAVSAFDALVGVLPEKSQARAIVEGSLLKKLIEQGRGLL